MGWQLLDEVRYWLEVAQEEFNCFDDIDKTVEMVGSMGDSVHVKTYEGIGVVAYIIHNDFFCKRVCSELFLFIKKENRGNPRTLLKLIGIMEEAAKKNSCQKINFGANIGYRDDKLLKIMQKRGYKPDTLTKEV